MSLPRILPRLTVRRLMVAVAIVAVGIGGTLEFRRLRMLGRQYSIRALRAGGQANWYRTGANMSHEEWLASRKMGEELNQKYAPFTGPTFPDQELCKRLALDYESRRLKYARAARYPFLPIDLNQPPSIK